jgi:hypothetical protein
MHLERQVLITSRTRSHWRAIHQVLLALQVVAAGCRPGFGRKQGSLLSTQQLRQLLTRFYQGMKYMALKVNVEEDRIRVML